MSSLSFTALILKRQNQVENIVWSLKPTLQARTLCPADDSSIHSFFLSFVSYIPKYNDFSINLLTSSGQVAITEQTVMHLSIFPSHGEHKRSRTDHPLPLEGGGHHRGHEIAFPMHQLKWPPHSN